MIIFFIILKHLTTGVCQQLQSSCDRFWGSSNINAVPCGWNSRFSNLNDYTYEELAGYKEVFLNGFTYDDKETAEDLVLRLSRAGVKVIMYADGIPQDKRTHSQNFLGVTCSSITFHKDIRIWIQELERYIQICFHRDILHGIQCILMDLILCGELFMIMDWISIFMGLWRMIIL